MEPARCLRARQARCLETKSAQTMLPRGVRVKHERCLVCAAEAAGAAAVPHDDRGCAEGAPPATAISSG